MRSGFTLLELMVVAAVLVIVTMMAFGGFRYLTAVMNKAVAVTGARENLTVVMDQLTKELREVTSVSTGPETNDILTSSPLVYRANYGVTLPATFDVPRGVAQVLSGTKLPGTLVSGDRYTFRTNVNGDGTTTPNGIILEFFTIDTSLAKHRIRYSVTAPKTSGGVYNGLGQGFWASIDTEPCEMTYCNNIWNGSAWSGELPQPMTDQVVTGFSITRPLWSLNVMQITLEAQVRGLGGTGYSTVRLIGLVTVRQ
jgi:prepilin-type N-terminal cleavage/methylation domain-containing protein